MVDVSTQILAVLAIAGLPLAIMVWATAKLTRNWRTADRSNPAALEWRRLSPVLSAAQKDQIERALRSGSRLDEPSLAPALAVRGRALVRNLEIERAQLKWIGWFVVLEVLQAGLALLARDWWRVATYGLFAVATLALLFVKRRDTRRERALAAMRHNKTIETDTVSSVADSARP